MRNAKIGNTGNDQQLWNVIGKYVLEKEMREGIKLFAYQQHSRLFSDWTEEYTN